ncbi:unnamed protein product [Phytophthora lilii]|uniref:Unnamed protein product n=1 Tax=Phytophthora lilii TaxID=2077276 RepID=A0A9W6TU11_9STRA|nr:unnamed protein product [Phytophthora lilii]
MAYSKSSLWAAHHFSWRRGPVGSLCNLPATPQAATPPLRPTSSTMLARSSLRLPKAAARCISSSTPARVLQQTPATSGGSSSSKTSIPPVSQGEKAWCDIYGVDYEKQIQEALQESPAAAQGSAKKVNYPTAAHLSAKAQSKADIWNVVFGEKKSA